MRRELRARETKLHTALSLFLENVGLGYTLTEDAVVIGRESTVLFEALEEDETLSLETRRAATEARNKIQERRTMPPESEVDPWITLRLRSLSTPCAMPPGDRLFFSKGRANGSVSR